MPSFTGALTNPVLTLSGTVRMVKALFVGVAEGKVILANELNTTPWDDATENNQFTVLAESTGRINQLNYLGVKTVDTQALEFPRDDETTTPKDIKLATLLLSIELLDGVIDELENAGQSLVSSTYGNIKSVHDRDVPPEHISHGILSFRAWRLLLPYLRDSLVIEQERVS